MKDTIKYHTWLYIGWKILFLSTRRKKEMEKWDSPYCKRYIIMEGILPNTIFLIEIRISGFVIDSGAPIA